MKNISFKRRLKYLYKDIQRAGSDSQKVAGLIADFEKSTGLLFRDDQESWLSSFAIIDAVLHSRHRSRVFSRIGRAAARQNAMVSLFRLARARNPRDVPFIHDGTVVTTFQVRAGKTLYDTKRSTFVKDRPQPLSISSILTEIELGATSDHGVFLDTARLKILNEFIQSRS